MRAMVLLISLVLRRLVRTLSFFALCPVISHDLWCSEFFFSSFVPLRSGVSLSVNLEFRNCKCDLGEKMRENKSTRI